MNSILRYFYNSVMLFQLAALIVLSISGGERNAWRALQLGILITSIGFAYLFRTNRRFTRIDKSKASGKKMPVFRRVAFLFRTVLVEKRSTSVPLLSFQRQEFTSMAITFLSVGICLIFVIIPTLLGITATVISALFHLAR